jgi:hypothetical protein
VRHKFYPNNYCTEQVNSSSNSSGLYLRSGQFEPWTSQNTGYPILSGMRPSPFGTATTIDLLHQSQMMDEVIMEQLMQWRLAGETRVLEENLPPQIPHDLTWVWTQAATMGSQRLTAWATAQPPGYPKVPLPHSLKFIIHYYQIIWQHTVLKSWQHC